MKNTVIPETFAELLEVAQKATILSWSRDSQTLSLTLDDIPGDRRTCLAVRIERQVCEVRTLSGYDAKKNRWGEYCSPKGDFTFPDKRGLKALREWIQVRAQETTGYPNPEFLTIYSAPAETVKPRDGELFARPGAAD